MTRLFIENREIELDESVQFAITKQFEDLSNPTDIINDWSKTVSIPFTANNNEIFGHIYNPDRLIVVGTSDTLTGIYFDPLKKLDMRLQYGDNVLMTGYAKMNEIKQSNGKGTYEITLFGQLGKVLQEMSKITFDRATDSSAYLIDGSQYLDEVINSDLVYKSWTSTGQQKIQLYPRKLVIQNGSVVDHPGYHVTDIIGFAPNNAFDNGFDYKTYQTLSSKFETFTSALENTNFEEMTGVSPDSVIPNGLLPREIGEYRSYLQLPFIYWNKFFQMFNKKVTELTGYTIELDDSWFNRSNPYYGNLVMMAARPYDNQSDDVYTNGYYFSILGGTSLRWDSTWNVNKDGYLGISTNASHKNETYPLLSGDTFTVTTNEKVWLSPIKLVMQVPANYVNGKRQSIKWKTDKTLQIRKDIINADTNAIIDTTYAFYGPSEKPTYRTFIVPKESYEINTSYNGWDITLPAQTITKNIGSATHLKVKYTARFNAAVNDTPWESNGGTYKPGSSSSLYPYSNMNAVSISFPVTTGTKITFNDLWNNEFSPFSEIIKYCKIFRIAISVDDVNKTIKYTRQNTYFNSYGILDWTDKIDFSKDYTIKPISFENKYVLFNYEKSDLKGQEDYQKRFGYNYGEKVLNTNYNFNNETKNLFEKQKVYTSINNSDNVLSWTSLYENKQIVYTNSGELFVLCKDKDDKYKKQFGNYFFFQGLATFSTQSPMRNVIITDDSDLQIDNNIRCYGQSWNYTDVSTYPKLTTICDNTGQKKLCIFNKPSMTYSTAQDFTNAKGIYDMFWKNYLDERYNIQNKILTCYLKLTQTDFINFKFSNFVKIGNMIYFVNKIYDYNIETMESTKVDMVSINDITGYTTDNYIIDDSLVLNFAQVSYLDGNILSTPGILGTFETLSKVYFENGTEKYTIHNIEFTIDNNENVVYYQTLSKYVDKDDLNFTITLHNSHNSGTIKCQRYSIYPYPWIIIENDKGTEVSTIYPGSRVYKLKWHGTDTVGLDNKPTVTIENHGTGTAKIQNDWTEKEVMIQVGDDEWFKNEYVVTLNTNMVNYSNTYLRFIVTDKEGWHETRDYYVSL